MRFVLSIIFVLSIPSLYAKSAYDYQLESLSGDKIELSKHKGKTTLVVNIATQCGYTRQLGDLEKLYQKYKAKGLVVIGVPSNEFGGQTPEEGKAIAKFCNRNYGVSFPIVSKAKVNGDDALPLMKHLIAKSGNKPIGWNFEKFLIGPDGKVASRFPSYTKPLDKELTRQIESKL